MSALFWGMLWGPVGLLLSMPLTICLLVLGTHVPHLGFLQVLLGDEPALSPYQQIYRRLIAKAVADASTVALAEIEEKGWERGLDDGMGRMVVLAEADRAQDRLSGAQVEAIVDGTDEVLDFIAADERDAEAWPAVIRPAGAADAGQSASDADRRRPAKPPPSSVASAAAGRSTMPPPRSSPSRCASRASRAESRHHADKVSGDGKEEAVAILLICYASPPSDAIRRYTLRKLTQRGAAGPGPPSRDRLPGGRRTRAVGRRRRRPRRHFCGRRRRPLPARGPACRGGGRSSGAGSGGYLALTQASGEVAGDALAWRGFQRWRLLQGTALFGDRAARAEGAAARRIERARRLALHRHVPARALDA